jgi:vancomycin resistance protein VanW
LGVLLDFPTGEEIVNEMLETRRTLCQTRRWLADWVSGRRGRFACAGDAAGAKADELPVRFRVSQPILRSEGVEAKLHNIRLALETMNSVVLPSGGIFSFWRLVGRPSAQRGFRAGRSLLGGRLTLDCGGGLCQLSGIIYHTALLAGLRILERHSHSVDLYKDEARYTPLGADATVAFGFKDLRFENTLSAPVSFRLALAPGQLTTQFCSAASAVPREVVFVRVRETPHERIVETRVRSPGAMKDKLVAVSRYRVAGTSAE